MERAVTANRWRRALLGSALGLAVASAASAVEVTPGSPPSKPLATVPAKPAATPAEVAADCPDPNARPGFLSLNTVPWTQVLVDGQVAGSTPLFRFRVPAGPHKLTLVNEAEGLKHSEDVEIESGRIRKLSLVLLNGMSEAQSLPEIPRLAQDGVDCGEDLLNPGYITVQTEPWAVVYLDGRSVGSTPLYRHRVPPGMHVMRLFNEQATPRMNLQMRIEVAPDENLKVVLQR